MEQYILESVLLAKIENIRKHYIERDDFDIGWNKALDKMLSFIDTTEAKEVDLDFAKEVDVWVRDNGDTSGFFNVQDLAKHFFDLGLKVNKGEDVLIKKMKEVFCKAVCNGNPPHSTCTSLGTCKEYDNFVKFMKEKDV